MTKFGLFNQPKIPSKNRNSGEVDPPWKFRPSDADQRGAPSAAAGTYWGTGMKAPIGRMRSDSVGYRPVDKKQLGTPPSSLV